MKQNFLSLQTSATQRRVHWGKSTKDKTNLRGPHPRITRPSEQSKEKDLFIRVGVKVNND